MGNENTQLEKSVSEMKGKLNRLLDAVEAQHPFSRNNFVSMRKMAFLWIVGDWENRMGKLLAAEIQSIVDDERTIWILHSGRDISEAEVYARIYQGIESASRNYLSVDMDHLMICPIFLPGCFQNQEEGDRFISACLYVQRELRKRHRYPEWSPYLLLKDERVDMTAAYLGIATRFMDAIMEDGRRNYVDCCCPCCVIFDVNEKGQEICDEQKAKVIVMLAVFRNTSCENEELLNEVLLPMGKEDSGYFFTARAISICEPVKSLTLNRLLAVHSYFLQGRFSQEKLYDNWKHTFFEGSIWKRQLDGVAHDEKYAVLTAPVYSNIPVNDQRVFQKTLENFCKKYYFEPLMRNEEQILDQWWDSFWEEYFLQLAGSWKSLDALEENKDKILDKVPSMNVKRVDHFMSNDLRRACEDWLVSELKQRQRYLVERVMKPDGRYMQRFRMKKAMVSQILEKMESTVKNQIVRLRQSELLLNTGGGYVADPRQEAERWLSDYINNEPKKVTEIYRGYQTALCQLFQSRTDNGENIALRLLDIYDRIVSGSIESRESYMKTKLAKLAGTDMEQLIRRLGESWMYPVRLIGSIDQDKAQKLYVMGNIENFLCRKILEQPNYRVAFKRGALDDRLEIVRVSDRFTVQQIFADQRGE